MDLRHDRVNMPMDRWQHHCNKDHFINHTLKLIKVEYSIQALKIQDKHLPLASPLNH